MATQEPSSSLQTEFKDIAISSYGSSSVVAQIGHQYHSVTNHIHSTALLASDAYRACIRSSGEFHLLATEIESFRSILAIMEENLSLGDENLTEKYALRLEGIISGCRDCLDNIQKSVDRYNHAQTGGSMECFAPDVTEIMQHQEYLKRYLALLTALNGAITRSSQSAVQSILRNYIAEIRAGKRRNSVMSSPSLSEAVLKSPDAEQNEDWGKIQEELRAVGITPTLFEKNRDAIRKNLRYLVVEGSLQHLPLNIPRYGLNILGPSDYRVQVSETAFLYAIERHDLYAVRYMLAQGVDIETRNAKGESPIIVASRVRSYSIADELLLNGADTEVESDDGLNALQLVCVVGFEEIAKLLLERGAKPDTPVPPFRDTAGLTLLHFVACSGHMEIAKLLLRFGADPMKVTAPGITAFSLAIVFGRKSMAKLMLEVGADINFTDPWGATALVYAVYPANIEIVRFLVEEGANVNICRADGLPIAACIGASRAGCSFRDWQTVNEILRNGQNSQHWPMRFDEPWFLNMIQHI